MAQTNGAISSLLQTSLSLPAALLSRKFQKEQEPIIQQPSRLSITNQKYLSNNAVVGVSLLSEKKRHTTAPELRK